MKAAEPISHGSQPSADVMIRAARTLDVEAITAMSGMPGFRAGTLRLPFQAADRTRKFLEEQGENDMLLVAERDGLVVGSAGWKRFTGRRLHAAAIGMGVHDDHVGQGIGTALLGALIDAADNWYALGQVGAHRLHRQRARDPALPEPWLRDRGHAARIRLQGRPLRRCPGHGAGQTACG